MQKNISFILKMLGFFLVLFIWIYTLVNCQKLPETIPTHFGLNGKADDFGSKNTLWLLAGISTLLFLMLNYLSRNPQSELLNIPANLKEKPETAALVVDFLSVLVLTMFSVITYESIQTSTGKMNGLTSIIHYLLGLLFLFIFGMLIYSRKLSKNQKSS